MSMTKTYKVNLVHGITSERVPVDAETFSAIEITTPRGVIVIELYDREAKEPHDSFVSVRSLVNSIEVRPDSGNSLRVRNIKR